jgi:hypothetical protein
MAWSSGILPQPADALGLGLVLALVAVFLLANAILFRAPRALVAEHFGAPRQRLVSLRRLLFHRVQAHLGFLFLLVAFALQLYGHYGVAESPAPAPRSFPTSWVGVILLAVLALELGGWWLAHTLFLRTVREHFRANPPALENDLALARELGDLFGIAWDGNDTVQSYLARIRRRLGLFEPARESSARRGAPAAVEAEEGFV